MGKLENYSSYKDSGVEWLGEIPEHWKLMKLKFLANIKTGEKDTVDREDDGIYPFFVRSKDIKRMNTYSYDEEAVLTAGDGDIGKIFHYINGKFEYHQRVYKFSNFKYIIGKYLFYYLHHNLEQEVVKLSAKTTVDSLRLPMLQNFNISIPPKEEQTKIASFLDEKTSQIDEVISQKEKLIELLKERRQITINEAVTKGLDKDVEFKDSGVEWIGEIPKHWEVNRLKFLFKIKKRIAKALGYDVLSITQKGIKVKDIDSGEGQLAMDYSKYQLAFRGDFAMNHMDLLTGYIDISKFDGVISPDYRVFTLEDNNCIPEYYLRLFQMCYHEKIFYAFGQGVSQLGRWRFPADNFNNFFIPIPPKDEQIKIVEYIETQTIKIDKAIELQQNYIAKLKEYKASLIDSVVTGKVRVDCD